MDTAPALPMIIRSMCEKLGYTLDYTQPHLLGERSVMSPDKFVLFGTDVRSKSRVVIKASNQIQEKTSMQRERLQRDNLNNLPFAYSFFQVATELGWHEINEWVLCITEYIEQSIPFLDRPLKDQFFLLLAGFELQERVRAATKEHLDQIKDKFIIFTGDTYLQNALCRVEALQTLLDPNGKVVSTCERALRDISSNTLLLERYSGFLTHHDFVPHNFRVYNQQLYLLDHSDLVFGNKYDSWARLCNFLLLHNRPLEQLLLQHVKETRSEEVKTLHIMRSVRYIELIHYYFKRQTIANSPSAVLDSLRVLFWTDVLSHHLMGTDIPEDVLDSYRSKRDTLRSAEEQLRQIGLH